jgi:hypothetical protein
VLVPTPASAENRVPVVHDSWGPSATGDQAMVAFNLTELDKLERRERQLTNLAAVVVLVMAAGLALLMYPLVFVHPDEAQKWPLRFAFFGFCVLSPLIAAYLLDRQRTFRNVKQQLVAQLQKNVELQNRGNTDLLHTIPDLNHFRDRLAMDFRRAATMQRTLSVLLVKIAFTGNSGDAEKETAAPRRLDVSSGPGNVRPPALRHGHSRGDPAKARDRAGAENDCRQQRLQLRELRLQLSRRCKKRARPGRSRLLATPRTETLGGNY